MKKNFIIMLVSTLVMGIVIGFLTSSIFFNKKSNRLIVEPTKEYFRQKAIHLLNLDEAQLKQFENPINNFSDKAFQIGKENNIKMFNTLDSFYSQLKPALSPEQIEKFEKRLAHINALISK